jgi:RimJ/RimL family protein N-acetyltransferase
MIDFNLILQTDGVALRPISPDDYNSFAKITENKAMWIYFTSDLSVETELKAWMDQAIAETRNKTRLAFTIIDRPSSNPIGSTSIGNVSLKDKRAEIGWTWIAKDFQGKGINSQIKYLMIKYLIETLEFERVEFKTDVLNMPARKALIRIGAKEEGILRSHMLMTHNRRRDSIYYSILKSEWSEIKMKNDWR